MVGEVRGSVRLKKNYEIFSDRKIVHDSFKRSLSKNFHLERHICRRLLNRHKQINIDTQFKTETGAYDYYYDIFEMFLLFVSNGLTSGSAIHTAVCTFFNKNVFFSKLVETYQNIRLKLSIYDIKIVIYALKQLCFNSERFETYA